MDYTAAAEGEDGSIVQDFFDVPVIWPGIGEEAKVGFHAGYQRSFVVFGPVLPGRLNGHRGEGFQAAQPLGVSGGTGCCPGGPPDGGENRTAPVRAGNRRV